MVNKIKFDKDTIAKLPACERKNRYDTYYDTVEPNLMLMVTSTGAKTYYVSKKVHGQTKKIKIGRLDEVASPTLARKKAIAIKAEITEGKNPQVEKRRLNNQITFKALCQLHYEEHAKVHLKERSYKACESNFNDKSVKIYSRKLDQVTKDDIRSLHSKISREESIYKANRLLSYIKAVYNWGINQKDLQITNPAVGIKPNREVSRDRFMSPEECIFFFEAIKFIGENDVTDYLMILSLTGVRRNNILTLTWDNVDIADEKIYLPDTKNNTPQYVVITSKVADILSRRKKHFGNGKWVFPSKTSASGHLEEPKRTWHKVKKYATILLWSQDASTAQLVKDTIKINMPEHINANFKLIQQNAKNSGINLPTGLMDLRLHDLRRTLGSYMSMGGANQFLVASAMNHKSLQTTKRYAQNNLDPLKESFKKAHQLMGVDK